MPKMQWVEEIVNRVISVVFVRPNNGKYQNNIMQTSVQEYRLAGFQYYRAEGIWPFLRVGEALRLQREPHNRHDSNAIAVYFKNDMLGYIPSAENGLLAQMMDHGESLEASITQLLPDLKPWRGVKFSVISGSKSSIWYHKTLQMQW